ncbi:MAG: DNA translocase FtsK 4TM domain-containing protein [Bacilli bacterium]|nr:DNA translocase FtsK 4TM domain-containing protein [Bacilli bacterium]
MAKRKRKKQVEKSFGHSVELYGILFLLCSILGIGKFGPVGKGIASFSLFLVGSIYIVLLLSLFVLGVYLLIKREWPDLFSTKLIGIYLFVLGLLVIMHKNFITANDGNMMLIFKETINQLVSGFNQIMNHGNLNNWFSVGGGIIGGVFAILFDKLFSYIGMQIIAWVLMIVGVCLVTGFSIIDYIRDWYRERKESRPDKSSVKISDGNDEDIDDNHITISSIDELSKANVKDVDSKGSVINKDYQLPPLSLLNKPKKKAKDMDNSVIEKNIQTLEKVLRDFKINGKVVEVHIGPTVAQYEIEIASGTRVNKITSINRELALALAKKDVRIEAPIPGKNTVGVEFANDAPTPVSFYEIISSKLMMNAPDKKLMIPLGKSIMGDIGVCEINKMPHMLIAGTTGSGKSVCVNGIICSILMRARPDEVKLVMVDPKVVELSGYNGIPHLMCPVVTDPKKASVALAKMVREMERRYEVFSDSRTKNIEGYNSYVEKWNNKHKDEPKEKLPYIVVIIDELSDLMMVAAKEVEDSILRITQKARAAGIHLIVATQRPSTEVITGLIKANIPSRISFAVGSGIDSRTILDQTGAEKLLGKGDMLFLPIGMNNPTRIQGSFINDNEIKKIIDFTVSQQKAQYDDEMMNLSAVDSSDSKSAGATDTSDDDPLYNDIVKFVIENQKASASLLQRRFKLGYNRAARIIDLLEERGVIGPARGSKPREVLVKLESEEEKEEK